MTRGLRWTSEACWFNQLDDHLTWVHHDQRSEVSQWSLLVQPTWWTPTLSASMTKGLRWTSEACWSNQLFDVRTRSSKLLELTVLSKVSNSGCMILEKTQYFQFCIVHAATCCSNRFSNWLDRFCTQDGAAPCDGRRDWNWVISDVRAWTDSRMSSISRARASFSLFSCPICSAPWTRKYSGVYTFILSYT